MFNGFYKKSCAALVFWTIALRCFAFDFNPVSQFIATNFDNQTTAPNARNGIGAVGVSDLPALTNGFTSIVYSNPASFLTIAGANALTNGFASSSITNGLATTNFVQNATNGFVTQSVTNGLASITFVQSSTNGFVDKSITNGFISSVTVPLSATNWIPLAITNALTIAAGNILVTNGIVTLGNAWTIVNLNPALASATWLGSPTSKGGTMSVVATSATQVSRTNYFLLTPPASVTRTNLPIVILSPMFTYDTSATGVIPRFLPGNTNLFDHIYLAVATAPAASTTYILGVSIEQQ